MLACIDSVQARMPAHIKQQETTEQELKELKRNNSGLAKKTKTLNNKLAQEQERNRVLQ